MYREKLIKGVISLDGESYRQYKFPLTVEEWMANTLSCHSEASPIKKIFPPEDGEPKVVLFLDQFETVFRSQQRVDIESMIHDVAVASAFSRAFNVLIITQSEESCREILKWNGGQKIRPLFRDNPCSSFIWSHEELFAVAQRYNDSGALRNYDDKYPLLQQAIFDGNITEGGHLMDFFYWHDMKPNRPNRNKGEL